MRSIFNGTGVICALSLIQILLQSTQYFTKYHVILDRIITALECTAYNVMLAQLHIHARIPILVCYH